MSQEFNLRYNDIQPDSNANDNTPLEQSECVTYYETEGHARNVCFVLENGDRIFLNYAYLISAFCHHEIRNIFLFFTSHTVVINGENLDLLCYELFNHEVKQVCCLNTRYNKLENARTILINSIEIILVDSKSINL